MIIFIKAATALPSPTETWAGISIILGFLLVIVISMIIGRYK